MRNNKTYPWTRVLVLFLGLSTGPWLHSQSLNQLLEKAEAHYPTLQAQETRIQALQSRADQQDEWPRLDVMAGGFASPIQTRSGPQWAQLSAVQMFPIRGLIQAKEQLVNGEVAVAQQSLRQQVLLMRYQLKQAWYHLYHIEATHELLDRELALFASLEQVATAKVAANKTSMAEVLRLQMKIEMVKSHAETHHLSNEPLLIQLHHFTGIPRADTIQPPAELPRWERPERPPQLAEKMRTQHPVFDRLLAEEQLSSEKEALALLQNKWQFGVGLHYNLITGIADSEQAFNGRDALMPALHLKIPLQSGPTAARVQEQQLIRQAVEQERQAAEEELIHQLSQAYWEFLQAKSEFELQEKLARKAEELYTITLTAYQNDQAPFSALLQLQEEMLDYEKTRLEANVNIYLALAKIDYLQGS
ncbi:MAG: TolC family protein [Bacteroidota bacterium]